MNSRTELEFLFQLTKLAMRSLGSTGQKMIVAIPGIMEPVLVFAVAVEAESRVTAA